MENCEPVGVATRQNKRIGIPRPFDTHHLSRVDEAETCHHRIGPRAPLSSIRGSVHNKRLKTLSWKPKRTLFAVHAAEAHAEPVAVASDVIGDEFFPPQSPLWVQPESGVGPQPCFA